MKNMYNYILNLLFPKKCINCGKENSFLCEDCLSLVEINEINYCACPQNPIKNKLKCDNCPQFLSAVFTVLNEKQKISKYLVLKSETLPELNLYLSYLIVTYLKKTTNLNLNNNFSLFPKNKLTETLSKFTKIPITNKGENILLIIKKYPCEDISKIIETLEAKNVYILSLFREIKKDQNKSQF